MALSPKPLQLQPLTVEAFAPFGELIQSAGHSPELINQGRTMKFADLAHIDAAGRDGKAAIHLYRSTAVSLPFRIERMERHPLGSQAFMPLHTRPFPVIVAPPGDHPLIEDIRGFISNGTQGVNFGKGVWHHYQISLEEASDYLVIDRIGPGANFEEWELDPPLLVEMM